jgi:hypothetical protein
MSWERAERRFDDPGDPGRLRSAEDRDLFVPRCDFCGGAVFYPVTLQGVGLACSVEHLNRLEAQFTEAMHGRRD